MWAIQRGQKESSVQTHGPGVLPLLGLKVPRVSRVHSCLSNLRLKRGNWGVGRAEQGQSHSSSGLPEAF